MRKQKEIVTLPLQGFFTPILSKSNGWKKGQRTSNLGVLSSLALELSLAGTRLLNLAPAISPN